MAFNLGDKLEIASLRHDILQIQKHIDRLVRFVHVDSKYDFRSWKYPTVNALDVDVESILQNNSKKQALDELKSVHISLLNFIVDRLILLLQFTGITFQSVLTVECELVRKTNIGLIVKSYRKLTENVMIQWRKKHEEETISCSDSSDQTDSEEIIERNPCLECEKQQNKLLELFGKPAGAFKWSETITKESIHNFVHIFDKTCEHHQKSAEQVEINLKEMSILVKKNSIVEENVKKLKLSICKLETVNKANEQLLEEERSQQESQSNELQMMLIKLEELQRSDAAKRVENDDWVIRTGEARKHVDNLKAQIKKTELQLEMLDSEFERTTVSVGKKNDVLRMQIEATKNDMRKYDGFDKNWTLRYGLLMKQHEELNAEWQECQISIEETKHDMTTRAMQLAVLKDDKQQMEISIRVKTEELELIRKENEQQQLIKASQLKPATPKVELKNQVQTDEFEPKSRIDDSFKVDLPASFLSKFEKVDSLCAQSKNIRSLFADFLELPDFQNMPEWSLVPDFGVSSPDLDIFSGLGDVVRSRVKPACTPRSPKKITATNQICSGVSFGSSLSARRIPTAPQSANDVRKSAVLASNSRFLHESSLRKLPVSEASWVVTKPATRINAKKK